MTANGTAAQLPLSHLSVLELSDNPAGDLAGKLLADLGARVVKLEEPGRPGLRAVGPFAKDVEDPEQSLSFAYYNAGKESVLLDAEFDDSTLVAELLPVVDVLISTRHPADHAGLASAYEDLMRTHRELIVVSITPFGLDGPWSQWRASDLVSLALGGPLNMCGYDDHSIPPIRPGGDQGFHTATSFAHIGILLALIARDSGRGGQLVDVALHDALAVTIEMAFPYWEYQTTEVQRQTCRHAQPTLTQPTLFRCADGKYIYLVLIINEDKAWNSLVSWLAAHNLALDLTDSEYADGTYRQEKFTYIQGIVESFLLLQDSDTVYREGQSRGLPLGVVNAPEDLFDDPHLMARRFFQPVQMDGIGDVQLPGAPYRFDRLHWRIGGQPPRLGEHRADRGAERMGGSGGS